MTGKPFEPIAPARVDKARALFEQGKSIAAIAEQTGISGPTIARYRDAEDWKKPKPARKTTAPKKKPLRPKRKSTPAVKRSVAKTKRESPRARLKPRRIVGVSAQNESEDSREAIMTRAVRAVERQVAQIAECMEQHEDFVAVERSGRTIAVLLRALKELSAMETPAPQAEQANEPEGEDHEGEDLEKLADEYRARIAQLVRQARARSADAAAVRDGDAGLAGGASGDELVVPSA